MALQRIGIMRGASSDSARCLVPLVAICAVLLFLPSSAHATRHFPLNSPVPVALVPPPPSTTNSYPAARSIRVNEGHDAAVKYYQSLLLENPDDTTAATRIAASPLAPDRHDLACPVGDTDDQIASLKALLDESGYNRINIGKLFGVIKQYPLGPTYLIPVEAGSKKRRPPLPFSSESKIGAKRMNSLSCLISMFLLGFALHRAELEKNIIGGTASVELFESLGLAFPCEIDPSLVVPYSHLFPMEVPRVEGGGSESIVLATDLHPVALSRTTVGTQEEGAVMYVGPDSLALVQHLPLAQQVDSLELKNSQQNYLILDLCTGSGIQAIATLAALGQCNPTAKAICVDINERALRFTKFNSILNGMGERIDVLKGDISDDEALPMQNKLQDQAYTPGSLAQALRSFAGDKKGGMSTDGFDIVLSNPPFIPVPQIQPAAGDGESLVDLTRQSIDLRYGLFSSGGADGESILANILRMAPNLVSGAGFVGIVSEFMNPSESLCHKMEKWWAEGCDNDCVDPTDIHTGVLFTNEVPIDAAMYARRRANDDDEYNIWLSHLNDQRIASVSPGLLYIRVQCQAAIGTENRQRCASFLELEHILVPKSAMGSIWTPQNLDAINFTRKCWFEHRTNRHPQVDM